MDPALITSLPVAIALDREMACLDRVSHHPDERYLWFWQSPRSLVAPATFARKSDFAAAAQTLSTAGWPVALRRTSGDVTPQGPGVVNVTHVYATAPGAGFEIDGGYEALCGPICAALGPGAGVGWQPGAFCDGAYNVQYAGRKFAGTAMRFRPCKADRSRMAVLAHALMLMEPPSQDAIGAINVFLQMIGEARVIVPGAHTGLPGGVAQESFLRQVRDGFEGLSTTEPLPIEALPE